MADLFDRSQQTLYSGWGAGYNVSGVSSTRVTATKSIVNNNNGTATITATVTMKMNSAYFGGYSDGSGALVLHLKVGSVEASKTWKGTSDNWGSGTTHTTTLSLTFSLGSFTSLSGDLWVTGTNNTYFTFRSSSQGGNEVTGIPLGEMVAAFTRMDNFNADASSFTVTITKRSSWLTNDVVLYVNDTQIASWTGQGNMSSITLTSANQTSIFSKLSSVTSGTAKIIVTTKNGTRTIGTVQRTSTVTIPSGYVPSLTSITAAETNSSVSSAVGAYVQSLSRIKFTINGASAGKGSSIKSYRIEFAGNSWSSSTATTGSINKSGNITATGTVMDNRGRTASKTLTINLLAYSAPKLTSVSVLRSNSAGTADASGTWIRVNRVAQVSSLYNGSEKNAIGLSIQYKLKSASSYTEIYANTWNATTSITGYTVPSGVTFDQEKSYDILIKLSDRFNSTSSVLSIQTIKVPFSIGQNVGIGAGKIWERGALDIAGDVYHNGTKVDLATMLANISLLNGLRVVASSAGTIAGVPVPARSIVLIAMDSTNAANYLVAYGQKFTSAGKVTFPLVSASGLYIDFVNEAGSIAVRRTSDSATTNIYLSVLSVPM